MPCIRKACLLLLWLYLTGIFNGAAAQPLPAAAVIHPDSLRYLVETLADDSFMGRFAGSPECEKAAAFISSELQKAGTLPFPGFDDYIIPFKYNWLTDDTLQSGNIVAILPGKGKAGEYVVFSAHYDHVGTRVTNKILRQPEHGRPEKGDTIYNGANDNASGISALITLARYFGQQKNNERTIVFIAFSAEELGLLGSQQLSRWFDVQSVKAMINMDMVGRPVSKKKQAPYITGSHLSDLRNLLNSRLRDAAPGSYENDFFQKDGFTGDQLFARSDNYWFAIKGVPAHTILLSSPHDRYYHSLNDEPATLDYALMAGVVKAIALATGGLVSGEQTPVRINPARIKR